MDIFTSNRYRKDLGIQTLTATGLHRNDGKILLVFLALTIRGRFFVAMHHRFANALPFDEPVGFAAVDGYVVHANLFRRARLPS